MTWGHFEGTEMGIPTELLGHFALGMIWRGGIRSWPTPIAPFKTVKLDLGEWEERLRRYLIGDDPFPMDVCVWAMLATDQDSQRSCNFPSPSTDSGIFGVSTLGISFKVWLGNVPPDIKQCCCVTAPEKPIYISNRQHEQRKADKDLEDRRGAQKLTAT